MDHVSRGAVHLRERHDAFSADSLRQLRIVRGIGQPQLPRREQMRRQFVERPAAKRGAPRRI